MRTNKTLATIAALASFGLVQPAFAAAPAKPKATMAAKHAKQHRLAGSRKAATAVKASAPKQ